MGRHGAGALMLAAALTTTGTTWAGNFENECNLAGFAASLRQTVIVLDEHHVAGESGNTVSAANAPWRRLIGNLLFADDSVLEHNFAPRERVTIILTRKDGAGTRMVFTGCVPFFSASEKAQIARDSGINQAVSAFFGGGAVASAKKDLTLFHSRLGDSVREAVQAAMLSSDDLELHGGDLAQSGLATSLRQGALVNLAYGIPRVILYSDLSRFLRNAPAQREQARQAGFALAHLINIDFKGAEIYVVGMSGNFVSRDALDALFLASHGELISTGAASAVPQFLAAPIRVMRYQGVIEYPENRYPIRIRLATDRDGAVVDSWVSVQTGWEQFSPFHGAISADSSGSWRFTGDGVFAQVWNPGRANDGKPLFDVSLPFAGARILSLQMQQGGREIRGSISDTQIHFKGVSNYQLNFSAAPNGTGQF